MHAQIIRLPLPDSDDSHPLDWYPDADNDDPSGVDARIIERRVEALSGDVLPADGGFLTTSELRYVSATPTSLTFAEATPFDVWKDLTERLIGTEKRIHWYIADAINFGERKYGEMYAAAMDSTGWTYGTLANITSVGRKIESSRRREDVSFWDQREVASLPPSEADALLDQHQEQGWNQPELREKVKERKQEIARDEALAAPVPPPDRIPLDVHVEVADARSLPLEDASVHLIVTSPPYAVDKDYQQGGDVEPEDWRKFIYDTLAEARRVTVPTGRLALNVPLDTTKDGYRPVYSTAIQMAQAAGWTYRSTIVWFDDQLGKSVARGSMDSAGAPHVYAGCEMVALFSNGPWKRESDEPSDLAHDEWLTWTNGVWRFPGETKAWEGHPAPFPYELPRRLVKLLSFPGDVVLDPFCGSGTTILAAAQLHRVALGFDRSELYRDSTLRRVAR